MENPQVYKSNALVEASYRLSVMEQRIVLACIAQVRRDKPISADEFYVVSVASIQEMLGSSSGSIYAELEQAALKLRRREVLLRGQPDGLDLDEVLVAGWVDTVGYSRKAGKIRLRFHRSILPYLASLEAQFTRYALSDVAKMTSAHGIRLFEMLAQYGGVGERRVAVEDLRSWFQLEGSYPLFADLRRWVIEPAVAQVNTHSPLQAAWSPVKTGRRVSHILFTFGPKPAKTKAGAPKPAPKEKPKGKRMTEAELAALARPGETWEELRARLRRERVVAD